jgi:hypothetical protein
MTDSDYTIFAWRQRQLQEIAEAETRVNDSSGLVRENDTLSGPTLHLHDPSKPLPTPGPEQYLNPSYYMFLPSGAYHPAISTDGPLSASAPRRAKSITSTKSRRGSLFEDDAYNRIPKHKREFDKFHNENGVRTVVGTIGSVKNGVCVLIFYPEVPDHHIFSSHATKGWIPACLHLEEIC